MSAPGPIDGTTTITPPGTDVSWTLQADESRTFPTGVISSSEPSVTFDVEGTWSDGETFADSLTLDQPDNCTPTTTSTTTTTTTTVPDSTTTSVPGSTTTTTTIAGDLSITAITPVCQRDAPYVQVTFGNQPQFNGQTATVTFLDVNGVVVGTHTATYSANGSVRFLYPGASVDAAGNATDWPGWRFDGDDWVQDPSDRYLRDGLTVRVEVNPTATGQVSYPPATSGCANPPSSGGGGTPSLPVTGTSTGPAAVVAAGAIALGAAALVLARRRPGRPA